MKLFIKALSLVLICVLIVPTIAFATKKSIDKSITVTGIVKKVGRGSLKRHGGYYINYNSRKYILNSKKHLSKYLNKKVAVIGTRVNNLKGKVTVVKVKRIIVLPCVFTGVLSKDGDNYIVTDTKGVSVQLELSELSELGNITIDDLIGKTVLAKGESSLAPDNTTIIFKVKSISELVTLTGILSEFDGIHIALLGVSAAYLTVDGKIYVLISRCLKINLEVPDNYGKTAIVTGLLDSGDSMPTILVKAITVNP